jgi:hypothetical protein
VTTPKLLNAEAIVADFLKEQAPVAALVGTRVVAQTPTTTDKAWVRVTLIDPQNKTGIRRVELLVGYYLQVDCYAGKTGGQAEAFALAQAVRDALVSAPGTTTGGALITDAAPLSMPRSSDTDLSPARERFILDIELTIRSAL